jgi:hypothetical protein
LDVAWLNDGSRVVAACTDGSVAVGGPNGQVRRILIAPIPADATR